MSLDQITESIAHFAGHFHLAIEEARLRKAYEEFKALKREAEDDESNEFAPVRLEAPLDLEGFDPHSRYVPEPPGPKIATLSAIPVVPGTGDPSSLHGGIDLPLLPKTPPIGDQGGIIILPFVPIPSSAITITLQSIFLSDDDVLGTGGEASFLPVEIFHAALNAAIDYAESMTLWSHDGLAASILDDPTVAIEFYETLTSLQIDPENGATATILMGDDAQGPIVGGQAVEDLPELEDQLPAYIRAKRDEDAQEPTRDDKALPQQDEPDPFPWSKAMSGHTVVTGANEMVNEAVIKTNWIDAKVFAVAGDVVKLDAISQINVLYDRDTVDGMEKGGLAASRASNIADIAKAESSIYLSPGQSEGAGLPQVWNVERIAGDVTLTNVLTQYTFATDNDRLDLSITANSTLITTGENLTFNLAGMVELGFVYDVIFVGGSMVSLNAINQVNVLLDDDYFSGEGLGAASISGDDNLLRNEASIVREAADNYVDMAQDFASALRDMANGAADLAREVAQSEYFQGYESLRALYIEGNLTQMNIIDQINYLGDQDQVHMARDAMLSALDDTPVSIVSGSNMLTNRTVIQESGLDSQIMAAGGVYDDAVLYQAELIDTNAAPLGVGMSALATEAVAFLADDLAVPGGSDASDMAGFHDAGAISGTSFDVMQTMTT